MDPLFKAQAIGMLLLWIPLLAGFFVGRWVYPKLLRLLPAFLPLARSRSSTFMTFVNVTLFAVAMVLTTGMLAAKTLVWLQGLTFLPVTPTANWVRALSWLAAFFCGYHAAPLFEYPVKLRQELESEAAYRRNWEEYRRRRDAPKPSAKSSYPE
ncbi:hypothetical protein [Myxococcus faecalis]|uniref:hypothetical protein n=1 Tax=Myxococcus faecalis TaxID=3115646 RepID=UPI003CF3F34A